MVPINSDFMLDAVCLAAFSKSDEARDTLNQIVDIYQSTKKQSSAAVDRDMEEIFDIIQDILTRDADLSKKAEINRIVIKLKKSIIVQRDPMIIDHMIQLLNNSEEIDERRIARLLHRMSVWVSGARTSEIARQIQRKLFQFNPSDDLTNEVILNEIADFSRDMAKAAEGGIGMSETIDMVDLTDANGITRCLDNYQNKRKSNVFPTGLKALNRMLGDDGGFKRGEFWAFAASSHNYKSQMLMSVARWCVTLSHVDVAPGMVPCVVLISLENEVPENTRHLVERAYVCAFHQEPPKDIDSPLIIAQVAQYYNKLGMKFLMYRKDENFGYSDFVKLLEGLKKHNYEVVAVVLDYITLMRVEEDSDNPAKRLQRLAQRIYNYGQRNNMLIVTGLQLDSRADELNTSGQTNVVRSYGASHLGDCKGFRRELTGLIFMYIERNTDEVPYLTLCWSKHRDEAPPAKEDKYCAYRFMGRIIGIMDDIHLDVDLSVPDIYSDNPAAHDAAGPTFQPISVPTDVAPNDPEKPQSTLGSEADFSPSEAGAGQEPSTVVEEVDPFA